MNDMIDASFTEQKNHTGLRPTQNMRQQMTSYHACKLSGFLCIPCVATALSSKGPALLVICTLFCLFNFPLTAHAERTLGDGWFGDIQIGVARIDSKPSGVDVFDDTEKRDHLRYKSSDVPEEIPLIEGEIGYGFQSTGTVVLAGGGMEDPWRVAIGQMMTGLGLVSLFALYEEKEVWENPYLTGANRDETSATSFGYGVDWNNVLNTDIRIFTKRMEIEIDHDQIGDIVPDLRRDGTDTILGIRYPWNLGPGGVLSSGISYILIDRDGVANSGHGYAAELNHMLEWDRFSFATGLELVAREFDEIHPVVNEKREEAAFTLSETVSYAAPFGLENSYLFGIAAYTKTVADITFFEGNALILGAGVGCRF